MKKKKKYKEVTTTTTIILIVRRDNIYRLDLDDLKRIEAARWPATEEKVQLCLMKGQSVDDCHNYVKVLLSTGKRLFACGTGAFSPQCTWREVSDCTIIYYENYDFLFESEYFLFFFYWCKFAVFVILVCASK